MRIVVRQIVSGSTGVRIRIEVASANLASWTNFGVEEEQQIRLPVTQEIAGAAPVHPATFHT